jgi:hypothetical protein
MSFGLSAGAAMALGVGGGMLLSSMSSGGGGAPSADPGIGQAGQANAQVAADTLAWYKEKDAADKPNRDKAIKMALDQAEIQSATAKKQNDMADETYAYTKNTFRPLEQKIATDALGYDTPERRDSEAAQAQADIGSAADASRANMAREITSRGGDVNSGNFAASLSNASVRETAAKAGSGNQARKNVETVGAAKLADAANLGRGIASTNATQTQLGLSAGNSSVNNAQVPGNISAQQTTGMNQTASTAIQGNSSAGNLLLGQYRAGQTTDTSMQDMAALGTSAAALYTAFSDKNMKKDRKPVKPSLSMAGIRKTNIESWKYKAGSPGDDGGKSHTGGMAQTIRKNLGDAAAPGGKVIDMVSLHGHTMNAIKNIDQRLMRLEDAKPSHKTK